MKALVAALLLALPGAAGAHEYTLGELTIAHPAAPETPPTARSAAGYLSITNGGAEDDALLAVETSFPQASIHRSEIVDGVARMEPVERLAIPAGETVTLAPGGLHVMFMGLDTALAEGDRIPATLVFEEAGRVDVTFNVEARDGHSTDGHQHE